MKKWSDYSLKEVAQIWVDALRSGEYKQARAQLYNPLEYGYCCLGVLRSELTGLKGVDVENTGKAEKGLDPYSNGFTGLFGESSEFFWHMNDDKKMSFGEIADVIEGKYLK